MSTNASQTVLSPWLTPVRLVSVANIAGTYYNGPNNNGVGATLTIAASSLTIDSVVCVVGDRVLLHTQTNTYEQGVYIVKSIGSTVVLERSADQQSREQMKAGQYVSVGAGSIRAGNFYSLVEPLPNNIGVDAIVWNADPSAGGVTFSGGASTANALAVFSDTAGNLKAQTTTSTLGFGLTAATGNLQAAAGNVIAGASGAAGYLASFPSAAAKGSLRIQGVANTNDDLVTISNALHGQATVYSIPDVGAATGQLLNKTAALVSGNFIMASGTAGKVVDSGVPQAAGMNYATVAISAAEFNGMYAAPKLLVAAGGANTLLVLHRLDLLMTYVSANYAAGGVAAVQYDSTANGAGVIASTTLSAATFQAAASTGFVFNLGVVPQTFSTCVNKGLYLSNITGAFTTGDSTFVAHIWYSVIATV